ncbi:Acetyl-CoA-benzylalcohol acetyltransferase [Bertholletia excelsa]
MATMFKPQILSKKLIKPSTPTPSCLQKHNLSLMDQLVPPTALNIILCYSSRNEETKLGSKQRCSKLENSLSEALTKFYPLAGRLVIDELWVDCSDQGVELLEARVDQKLSNFLHGGPKIEELDQLVPWENGACDSASTPLVAVQINMFNCGGLIVGVQVSHKVADPTSVVSFINGWASASRGGMKGVMCPSFNLGTIFPPSNLLPSNPPSKIGTQIVTRIFHFSEGAIRVLEEESRAASAPFPGLPSREVAVAAVLWRALIGVARVRHRRPRPSLLVYAVNLRGRVNILTPENAFGNLPVLISTQFREEEGRAELHDLVALLADKWRESNPAKAATVGELCSMVTSSFGKAREEKFNNPMVDVHLCSSWCGLPLYEADFGWGKPIWVGSTSKQTEVVSLMDSGYGVDAWVSLDEEGMAELENDSEILSLTY